MAWTAEKVKERLNCLNNSRYFYTKTTDSPLKVEYSFVPILKDAAVLIPLYYHEDELRVLLTIRSKTVRTYSGQVAFPGGIREDSDENPIETALREAEEEIGLKRSLVKIVGCLKPVVSRTKVLIFPIVGFIENFHTLDLALNKDETEFYFSLPLERFLKADGHATFPFEVAPDVVILVHNFQDKLLVHHVYGDVIDRLVETFGLTAALCIFCSMVIHKRFVQYSKDIITEDELSLIKTNDWTTVDDKLWMKLYDEYFNGYLEKLKLLKTASYSADERSTAKI